MQSLPWTFTNRFISTAPKINIPNDCSKEMKEKIEKIQEERTQTYLEKIWETMNEEQKLSWVMK
jgi:hypothetical protein